MLNLTFVFLFSNRLSSNKYVTRVNGQWVNPIKQEVAFDKASFEEMVDKLNKNQALEYQSLARYLA